jgi:hypothetical protein
MFACINVKLAIGQIGTLERRTLPQATPNLIRDARQTIAELWTQVKIQNGASAVGKKPMLTHMDHGQVKGATLLPKQKEETPLCHFSLTQVLIFVDYNARLHTGAIKGRLRSIQLTGS